MQNLATLRETSPPIGYNDKFPPHELPQGFCSLIQNGFLDNFAIQQRDGYSLYGNDTGESFGNLGFHAHETTTHTQLLKIQNNSAGTEAVLYYKNNVGNWILVPTPTFTANVPCNMVTAAGKTYITNGIDTVKSWDGTTLANVPSIPITRYLRWFHNYLWALHNPSHRSRAYFSSLGTPETFPVSNFIDTSPEDGDYITGTGVLKDEMIIGKQYKVYSFQGWTEATFSITSVNENLSNYGVVSNESFVNIGNDLLFLSYGGDIPHFRSLTKTRFSETAYGGIMSEAIEGSMRELSKGQLSKCSAVFDGRKVWFFVPNASSAFNNLVLVMDVITGGWSKHTGIFSARAVVSTISGKPEVYFADSRNARVYKFDSSTSDNGNPIDFQFVSRQFEPDFKRFYKFKYLFVQVETGLNADLDVFTSVDDNPFDFQQKINLLGEKSIFPMTFTFPFGNSTMKNVRIELPYGVNHNLMIKFAKNDTLGKATILHYELMGQRKAIRDL